MMESSIKNAFLPGGVIGRDGVGVTVFKTNISPIFSLFKAFAERSGASSGVVYPYELDSFTVYRRKKSFFRPTDVIYTADKITISKKAARSVDYYCGSLYELFVSCPSFTIDTSLIGTNNIISLAERIYFVFPAGKKRLVEKTASFTSGLRQCGIVTSDGMIRFIRNGIFEEFEKSSVPAASPISLAVNSPHDFNCGCFDAFDKCLENASKYRFPFRDVFGNYDYSDAFTYRLGQLAVSSRDFSDGYCFQTENSINCAGFCVSVIPLFCDNGIFPFERAFALLNTLKNDEKAHNYFSYAAIFGDLPDYVNRLPIKTYKETAVPQSDGGYIIVISDTPTSYSRIGYVI